MMAVARCSNFDSDFFNKYATLAYYLSRGASGNVYGPIPWNGKQLAIKQVMFADGKVTDEFKKKIEVKEDIWTSLEHKHLTRIHSVDLTQLPKAMFIVMEFAAGGSLHKTLRSLGTENKLPIDVVTDWAKQIAEGMLYLHEKNIVHRDLKSANILLMEAFNTCNPHLIVTVKITDFDEIKEHDHTTTMSLVGTCAYMAPEVLVNQWFSKASDVWSFGVVVWEMLSGDIPHKGLEPRTIILKSQVGKLDNLPIEQSVPEDYKLILKRSWKSTCRKRPSFHDIFCVLQHMADGKDVTEILKCKGNMLQKYFRNSPKVSDELARPDNEDSIASKPLKFKWGRVIRETILRRLGRVSDDAPTENEDDIINERLAVGRNQFEEDHLNPDELLQVSGETPTENEGDIINERLEDGRKLFEEDQLTVDELLQQPFRVSDETPTENEGDIINERLEDGRKEFEEDHMNLDELLQQPARVINGLAVLGMEEFISRLQCSDIEVYNSTTFYSKRRMTVNGMTYPEHIVSCSVNNCLYTFDWKYKEKLPAMLRIDPNNGKMIKIWTIDGRGGRLSVANDTNLILNINNEAMFHEYTANGVLIRKINLDLKRTRIFCSWHAVKLDSGLFVVSHGSSDGPLSRVCLLSTNSTTNAMGRTDEVEILKAFGAEPGESINSLMQPMYLSVNKAGSILVTDASNRRAVLLSSDLNDPQILVSDERGLELPKRTCFDESTGQWFVADCHGFMVCRVKEAKVG